jgi:ComF family protein
MYKFFNNIQTLLPKNCILCGLRSDTTLELCKICYQSLPWLHNACYQCGVHLENMHESIRCRKCIISPPVFDRVCAMFNYDFPLNKIISQLKFKTKLACGKLLGQLLLQQYQTWYTLESVPEAILPVPLSSIRLRQRGFNQVLEILRPLILATKFPLLDDVCIRVKNTKPQTSINMKYRKRNLLSAFRLLRPIRYSHIAIVDDVFTTGSTISAVSIILRNVGVQQIDIWCICRTQNLRNTSSIQDTHQIYKPHLLE